MKIIFNLLNTGLGNNGGSLTLIKSANTLKRMGHDVIIISNGKNQNTWQELFLPHIIIPDFTKIPEADVIIATGIKSVDSTDKCKIKNKFFWIRGWETWNYPEEKIVQILKDTKCKKIVNSLCLQNKLSKFKIESDVVRPGYDFDEIYPLDIRHKNKTLILGGLYNEGKKREGKRTNWIIDIYQYLVSLHCNVELHMFGTDGIAKGVTFYSSNPNKSMKNIMYNTCDIWLAPTENEGLHLPPAEAGLTECPCVGTNTEMNGMDYLIDNETGLISENTMRGFMYSINTLISNPDLRIQLGKNLRKKVISFGDREENMKRMIEVFKK